MSIIQNKVPQAPPVLESKTGWGQLSFKAAAVFDEDISHFTNVAVPVSGTVVASIHPISQTVCKTTGLVDNTSYVANISCVDQFLSYDLEFIKTLVLNSNTEVIRFLPLSIQTKELPSITSAVNEIVNEPFTSTNVAIYFSGYADYVVIEVDSGTGWVSVYSGDFLPKVIFELPIGSYSVRANAEILHLDATSELSPEFYSTLEVTELGTGWVAELQEDVQETKDLVINLENEVTDGLNLMQQQVDQTTGAIASQVVSVNKALKKSSEGELNQLLAEYSLYLNKKEMLAQGQSIASAEFSIQAVANETLAVSQSLLELTASTGIALGQVNAEVTELNQAITSDEGAVALRVNALRTSMNAPETGEIWALSEDISRVETKADGSQLAIAGLRTAIGATGETEEEVQSSAELILSTIQEESSEAYSRAYLGVTNVVGGRAVISGIAVGGTENGLSFQGDVFRLTDTSGAQKLYWDAATNTWILRGKVILGDNYEVSTEDDIRALDGADGPAGAGLYGSSYSSISWTTATATSRFTALSGRAPVVGDILSQTRTDQTDSQARQFNGSSWVTVALQVNGSIVATGTIAGNKLVAGTSITAPLIQGGTFTGSRLVTTSGTGVRVDVGDDGTYLIWAGSGAKTDVNGYFWVKTNGTGFVKGEFFQGEIIETQMGSVSNGASIPVTATAGLHESAGKPVEVTGQVSVFFRKTGNTAGQTASMTLALRRGGTTLVTAPFTCTGFFEAEDGQTLYSGFVATSAVDSRTVAENRSYTAVLTQTGGAVPSGGVIINMTVKTFENKLA